MGRRVWHGERPAGELHSLMTSSREVAPGYRRLVVLLVIVTWSRSTGTEAKDGASNGCIETSQDQSLRSALGEDLSSTPQIILARENLDTIWALMKGDCYTGRGCRQRGLKRSRFANPFKVAEFGREQAITLFSKYLEDDVQLRSVLWTLSGLHLICHCGEHHACHGDSLVAAFQATFPTAYDRSDHAGNPPSSQQLNYLARLREELESDDQTAGD